MHAPTPRNRRYVGILALASIVILIGGWLARPRDLPQSPAAVPSDTELEQLARRTERRSLDSMAKYFASVAKEADASVARVRGRHVSGIVWDQQRILTPPIARPDAPRGVSLAVASQELIGQPTIWGPNLPLAAVAIDAKAALTPARRATSLPQPGEWLVAVWRTDTAPAFAAGNYRQTLSTKCGSLPVEELASGLGLVEAMVGGGIFDIDSQLVGMILPCDGRIIAIVATSLQGILAQADTIDQRLRGRYGLGLEPLSAAERDYFKTSSGLLIRDVWTGYEADRAGLRAGDVVVALNGLEVAGVDDLRAMASSNTPSDLAVLRQSKRLTIALPGRAGETVSPVVLSGTGLVMASSPTAYQVESVRPDGPAARAGVLPGDRLLRIDQAEPRNPAQVNGLLSGDQRQPMWLEVERGARRLGMLVR